MKISVAMTVYNGNKYIIEQMESIRNQSKKADEVIICDDMSTDKSVDIIGNYIEEHFLCGWKLFQNTSKLGWKENFRKAISLTSGDVIFFSDQDDVWMSDKIEVMTSLVSSYNIGCLYGKSNIIDGSGRPVKNRIEKKHYSGKLLKYVRGNDFYTVGGLGCCMCISREVKNKYLELDCKFDDHDSQCPRIAALYWDSLWVLDKAVIDYRIHQDNTSGISSEYSYGQSSLAKRVDEIQIIYQWLQKVSKDYELSAVSNELVLNAIEVEQCRLDYLKGKNKLFIKLLRYRKSYSGLTMIVGDFAYKHKVNLLMGRIRWRIGRMV